MYLYSANEPEIVDQLKIAVPKAAKVLSVLSIVGILRDCDGPLSLVKELVMNKIRNDDQEIKIAENKIKDLSKKMENAKDKTSKLLNQEQILYIIYNLYSNCNLQLYNSNIYKCDLIKGN